MNVLLDACVWRGARSALEAAGHDVVMLVRLVGIRAREQGAAAAQALDLHGAQLTGGAIVTVESDRIRVRETPK